MVSLEVKRWSLAYPLPFDDFKIGQNSYFPQFYIRLNMNPAQLPPIFIRDTGQILKWSTRRDCKSLALALRRFESCSAHFLSLIQKTFQTERQKVFWLQRKKIGSVETPFETDPLRNVVFRSCGQLAASDLKTNRTRILSSVKNGGVLSSSVETRPAQFR